MVERYVCDMLRHFLREHVKLKNLTTPYFRTNSQSKIQNDFKTVTGFAFHQEHILDVKKVSKETASELGQDVELSLLREHGRSPFPALSL